MPYKHIKRRKLNNARSSVDFTPPGFASFFAPISERRKLEPVWRTEGSLLICEFWQHKITRRPAVEKVRLAAFDLDSALICPRSGKTHAQDEFDWQPSLPEVQPRLKELIADGYTIVIFSNQNRLDAKEDQERLQQFKIKIRTALLTLAVPVMLYVATRKDSFRKPMVGMFEHFNANHLKDRIISPVFSFYVGQAAGTAGSVEPGYHARSMSSYGCADRKFARNTGLPFQTPEQFFLGHDPQDFVWSHRENFDPYEYDNSAATPAVEQYLQVLLLVGLPASGKTTFYFKHLQPQRFFRVDPRTLRSTQKCFDAATKALNRGESVVVDCTRNLESAIREKWMTFCKERPVRTGCVLFSTSHAICQHNNAYGAFAKSPGDIERHRYVLPVRIKSRHWKYFDWFWTFNNIRRERRFSSVIEVPFVPDPEKQAWRQWYECHGHLRVLHSDW